MEGRLIVFLVLSLLVLTLYPYLLEMAGIKPPEPVRATATPSAQVPLQATPSAGFRSPLQPVSEKTLGGEIIVVETPLYRATLSTRGAVIRKWELKQYTTHWGVGAPAIQLIAEPTTAPVVFPLSLVTDNPEVSSSFETGPYATNASGTIQLSRKDETATLLFWAADSSGRKKITKELTFRADSYEVGGKVWAEGLDAGYTLLLGTNFGIHDWGGKSVTGHIGPVSLINNEIVKDNPSKMASRVEHKGSVAWTALEDKYFLAALIPQDGKPTVVSRKEAEHDVTIGLHVAPEGKDVPPQSFTLYAGPKELDRLKTLNVSLDETIDFGWFMWGSWTLVRIIAKPLFLILRVLHGVIHNYGLAIIFLTMGIKLLFIPLTHKSYQSMKKMQALQPKVKELQKKYENDKERLNKELMALYQTNKVNPLGGCLPMLLQIPVFVALFNILYTTIELRQAPFYGWIHDLSAPDPIYVLPIIMGVTMVIQQKVQPTSMDPRQAKMMMFLPIIFTFFFLNFPAGLVLYWLVNNVLTIAQQIVTVRVLRPATSPA